MTGEYPKGQIDFFEVSEPLRSVQYFFFGDFGASPVVLMCFFGDFGASPVVLMCFFGDFGTSPK